MSQTTAHSWKNAHQRLSYLGLGGTNLRDVEVVGSWGQHAGLLRDGDLDGDGDGLYLGRTCKPTAAIKQDSWRRLWLETQWHALNNAGHAGAAQLLLHKQAGLLQCVLMGTPAARLQTHAYAHMAYLLLPTIHRDLPLSLPLKLSSVVMMVPPMAWARTGSKERRARLGLRRTEDI